MTNEKPLVSIIMPVYNTEKYLETSISSVIQQTYENWELMIVDDGSKDNSVSIIQTYAQKDQRIHLFINDSDQHGPGIARNIGLDHIRGKYTYFIDSDDWIDKDLLTDTVTKAEETGADLVPFGFIIEEENRQIRKELKPNGNYEYDDFKVIANDILRGTWSECHELIRSDLLKNVHHNHYKTGEDICFQMDLLCHVRKVCGIDREYYHYRVVNHSLSHNNELENDYVESNVAVFKKEEQFLEYCGSDKNSQIVKNTLMERYSGILWFLCGKRMKLSDKRTILKQIQKESGINKYKVDYDCSLYSGSKRILKTAIKLNMDVVILTLGSIMIGLQ